MNFIFYGNTGTGKTLSLIIMAEMIREMNKDKEMLIFTDIDYKYKNYELYELYQPEFQSSEPYKLVLWDEVDKFIDSRNSTSKINKFLSYVLSLSRKTNMDFLSSVQILSAVDKRIMLFTDFLISTNYDYEKARDYIEWEIYNVNTNKSFSKIFHFDKNFTTLYHSKYLTLDMINQELKKFNRYIKNFGKE